MGTWSPLDLQFPDLTVGAGVRLLPMQELESYIDDAFEKINQLKVLGRFYVVNGAEYANLGVALNDLWAQGINNVEILLRSGVNYTLPIITIASDKQVIIRGLGGRANLTTSGGHWHGTVIFENVNVTFALSLNSPTGTNTPTIVFRNCSITLNSQVRAENGTLVLKDCSVTINGGHLFLFNTSGLLLCDNVDALTNAMFVTSNEGGAGLLRFFFFNSTIRRQATTNQVPLVNCYGSLFAYNTVFDISQSTANPASELSIIFGDGRGSNVANNYFVLYSCEIRGNGSERNFRLATTEQYGYVYCINCRFLNAKRFVTRQFNSAVWATFLFVGCHWEYNRAYTSFTHDHYLLLNGFYSAIVSGNRIYYTGGTKDNGFIFLRTQSPKQCVVTDNYVENCALVYVVDGLESASNSIVPSVLIANNVVRNCFNRCIWTIAPGHVFITDNLIFHDYEQSWDSSVYNWSESAFNFYGAGILVHVTNSLTSYTRNQTLDDPLNIVVSNNTIIRRLANAIMLNISGTTNLFAQRVFVNGNVIIDCDPERLLSPSQWTIYNGFDNKRKGVGILLNAPSTTAPAQKMEPVIVDNYFINTRYAVYHALGKYGYFDGTRYSYRVIGNHYHRRGGAIASYLNPDTATDVYWFNNIGMDATAGANANVIRVQQQDFALPASVPTNEGSYIFPRAKEYDCAGGFAGGYAFGYIPSKIDIFNSLMLPNATTPNYVSTNMWYGVGFRSLNLYNYPDLRFLVNPQLFGSKTRNYRRMFLDIVLHITGDGTVVFDIVRIDPYTGAETVVVDDYVINVTGSDLYTAKIEVEATRRGFWIYSLRTTPTGTAFPRMIGLWLSIDEYYDYGVDSV